MTRKREIKNLLSHLPDEIMPQVIGLLRALTNKPVKRSAGSKGGKSESVASQTFGMMPADATIVRQALSEDLYELE